MRKFSSIAQPGILKNLLHSPGAMLYMITGNQGKYEEAKALLPDLERIELDLPEIQSLDSREIIREKLLAARSMHTEPLIVEDTAFHMDCLNGFPGPLIKWFLKSVGAEGIYCIAHQHGNYGVEVVCTIGYSNGDDIKYFEGRLRGSIVPPAQGRGFGWDPVFSPDGSRSFAEMSIEQKNAVSHRGKALRTLKDFLDSQATGNR